MSATNLSAIAGTVTPTQDRSTQSSSALVIALLYLRKLLGVRFLLSLCELLGCVVFPPMDYSGTACVGDYMSQSNLAFSQSSLDWPAPPANGQAGEGTGWTAMSVNASHSLDSESRKGRREFPSSCYQALFPVSLPVLV